MTAIDQVTAARRLADQDLSQREIARRLGLSRYKVTQLLATPPGRPADHPADRLADVVADQTGPAGQPVGHRSATGSDLRIDLGQWPVLRVDLRRLAPTGQRPEVLITQAMAVIATAYTRAVDQGALAADGRFLVADVTLRPVPHPAASR
ncbi:hypothetical protein CF54_04160 [Streptomyces sp. Tu 6176]|uniref:hypothetical protein n=1 Tax=Streptomyces sp. Tu 6176 TaxID=1470557 RepID=UPI00044D0803|nr:hypothetical protein [Streptomyces sp. Tu 6176]EYT83973.1 hypothetical protein CF54_04160 [Streptomyces sp. Tu 6176]